VSQLRVEHVGLWVRNLELMRDFYVAELGGRAGPLYENARTGFRSYFLAFGDGARLELMSRPLDQAAEKPDPETFGYAHVAFRLDSRGAVDAAVDRLEAVGVVVLGRPRLTGDGYYEAVVRDPEGNRIELVASVVDPGRGPTD
jgi:lactoylglutathione lyase